MSKQKIRSDFDRLEYGNTKNSCRKYSGIWSFNKCMEISSAVERMVLPSGYKLGKNETNDADTLTGYNS